MPNELSEDVVIAGDYKTIAAGLIVHTISNTVARTDTAAKSLGVIPASANIIEIIVYGATGSDAGTTATLSIGKSGGTGTEYLNAQNIKGAAGVGQIIPASAVLGGVGTSNVTVTGIYAESGSASTVGGPWTVLVLFTT